MLIISNYILDEIHTSSFPFRSRPGNRGEGGFAAGIPPMAKYRRQRSCKERITQNLLNETITITVILMSH